MRWLPLACLLLVACAPPRVAVAPAGFTMCADNEHHGYVRLDVLTDPYANVVIAHERKHIEQMRLIAADCKAWDEWMKVPANRARAEAAAFCVSAIIATREGMYPTLPTAINAFAVQLSRYESLGLTPESAHDLIVRFCS